MRTYYITGISGFLGQTVLKEISKEKDYKVFGLVLENDKYIPDLVKQSVNIIYGNILNKDDVDNFLSQKGEGERIILHIAGRISTVKRGDKLTTLINVDGTKNIVDAANKYKHDKLIYVASTDALDPKKYGGLVSEQDRFNLEKVKGVYAESKVIAGNYVLDNATMKTVIICPSAIYGPDDKFNSPINTAINMFIKGKMPGYVKGGYDIVDVRDVARAMYQLIDKGKDKNMYIVSGHHVSVKNLFATCGKVINKKPPRLKIWTPLVYIASPFIELWAKMRHKKPLFSSFSMYCLSLSSNFSKDKIKEAINYQPTELVTSLKDTIMFYKKEAVSD